MPVGLFQRAKDLITEAGIVDVTVKQLAALAQMEIDLLRAIRAQKNAVILTDDDESKKFAIGYRHGRDA